jgi:hypothetical protein
MSVVIYQELIRKVQCQDNWINYFSHHIKNKFVLPYL